MASGEGSSSRHRAKKKGKEPINPEKRNMFYIWFRYGGQINQGARSLDYVGGQVECLETHRDLTLWDARIEARRLCGIAEPRLLYYDCEDFNLLDITTKDKWDSIIANGPSDFAEFWVFPAAFIPGAQEDDYIYEYDLQCYIAENYDSMCSMMGSALRLRGGNPEDGECRNGSDEEEFSNIGVSTDEHEEEVFFRARTEGLNCYPDAEAEPVEVPYRYPVTEAEPEETLEYARSNYQDIHSYDEALETGDWVDGFESSDWDVQASLSTSNVSALKIGDSFDDKEKLQLAVQNWHINMHRQYKTARSSKTELVFTCLDDTCSWKLRAKVNDFMGLWKIKKCDFDHTCQNLNPLEKNRQLNIKLIYNFIYQPVQEDKCVSIANLQSRIHHHYKQTPSYRKVWCAKSDVIETLYGTHESAFGRLPEIITLHALYNPGTVFDYEFKRYDRDCRAVFGKWFWSYAPAIAGFLHCRPVISIDATHLYGKYKGKLLAAVAFDADNGIFPLAFAFGDGEGADVWTWFLQNLRKHVTKDARKLCILSDRAPGIKKAVDEVFPDDHHRWCARHLASNFNTNFRSKKLKTQFEELIWTTNKKLFLRTLEDWKTAENGRFKEWIESIGPISMWSQSHDGGVRYGNMTTNHSEVFNKVLMESRWLPISAIVKATFYRSVKWWYQRTKIATTAKANGHTFLPKFTKHLQESIKESADFTAEPYQYGVEYGIESSVGILKVVNLRDKTCECGEWQLFGWPCRHAICAIKKVHSPIESFVDNHFKIDKYLATYAYPFHPPRSDHDEPLWQGPEVTYDPNMWARGPGRKKGKRIPNEMDTSKQPKKKKCSNCGQLGHNKRSCQEQNIS